MGEKRDYEAIVLQLERLLGMAPEPPKPVYRRRPIDVLLLLWPHTPSVTARLRKYNPRGVPEGGIPRGWHPARTLGSRRYSSDVTGPKEFIAQFGRAAYYALPRHLIGHDGHRKLISGLVVRCRAWESQG